MACHVILKLLLHLKKNALLRNIQLKLNGKLVLVDGIIFGSRKDNAGHLLYVVMFTNGTSESNKIKIHTFIRESLQERIDKEIDTLYK